MSARQHSSWGCEEFVAALGGDFPVSSSDKGCSMTLHGGDLHGSRGGCYLKVTRGFLYNSVIPYLQNCSQLQACVD